MRYLTIAALAITILTGCKKEDDLADAEVEQTFNNVNYADDGYQQLDIYLPAGRSSDTKILLFIHDGGWSSGDKSDYIAILSEMEGHGFAIANMNFRPANTAGGIQLEQIAEDIHLALEYLKNKAVGFVYSPDKIIIAGHGSGGQLALYTAYHNNADNLVKAAISLAGQTDLTDDFFTGNIDINAQIENLLGVSFATDPAIWENASPVTYASASVPPTLLQYCFFDAVVPVEQGDLLDAALTSNGVDHTYIVYPGYEHDMGAIFNEALFPDDVKNDIYDFIESHAN